MAMPSRAPDGWTIGDSLDEDWLPLMAISSKDPSWTDEDRLARINDARVDEQMRRERAWHQATGTPFQPDSPGNGDRGTPFVKPAGGNGNRPANPRGRSGAQAQPSPPDNPSSPPSGPAAGGSTTAVPPHPVPVFSAPLGPVIQLSTLAGDAIQVLTRETLFRKDAIKVRDNYRKLKSLALGHDHSRHFDSTITPWLTLTVQSRSSHFASASYESRTPSSRWSFVTLPVGRHCSGRSRTS